MIPFFAIDLPANALAFFHFKFQIAAFEMIPIEFMTEGMLAYLEAIKVDERVEQFEPIGFESVWVLANLGSFLFFFALFPLRLLGLPCLSLLAKRWPRYLKRRKLCRNNMLWNWPIQTIRDSYIVLVMGSLINVSFVSWADTSDSLAAQINLVIAYVLVAFTVLYPILQQVCLFKNRH